MKITMLSSMRNSLESVLVEVIEGRVNRLNCLGDPPPWPDQKPAFLDALVR